MSESLMLTVLSLVGTGIGSISGILISAKLTNYRIECLEKKVEKHNSVIERTGIIEEQIKEILKRLDRAERGGEQ